MIARTRKMGNYLQGGNYPRFISGNSNKAIARIYEFQ